MNKLIVGNITGDSNHLMLVEKYKISDILVSQQSNENSAINKANANEYIDPYFRLEINRKHKITREEVVNASMNLECNTKSSSSKKHSTAYTTDIDRPKDKPHIYTFNFTSDIAGSDTLAIKIRHLAECSNVIEGKDTIIMIEECRASKDASTTKPKDNNQPHISALNPTKRRNQYNTRTNPTTNKQQHISQHHIKKLTQKWSPTSSRSSVL